MLWHQFDHLRQNFHSTTRIHCQKMLNHCLGYQCGLEQIKSASFYYKRSLEYSIDRLNKGFPIATAKTLHERSGGRKKFRPYDWEVPIKKGNALKMGKTGALAYKLYTLHKIEMRLRIYLLQIITVILHIVEI